MKKVTFIVLLVIESIADLIGMALLMSDLQEFSYLVGAAILTVIMLPFFLALKKTKDEAKKEKIRRNLVLAMLTPVLVTFVVIVTVIIGLMRAIG